ncbi:MAG: aldo/keto reductase [Anaerolineales bacterium]|nr:aldo/keto reductase [Anaerolineales bacterium]MCW5855063.1 aldo/keto reductase [Anaerolineales bacterium]
MNTIRLGADGPEVSAIGVGCWAWGDEPYWSSGQRYSSADVAAAYQTSLNAGLNFFDTAELYALGRSERVLGQLAAGNSQVYIASKFFPYPWRISIAQFREALRRSVERLGSRPIQLYQIHWPFPPRRVEYWMDAMAEAVQAGQILQIGVSNYSPQQMERAQAALEKRGLRLASNQVRYHLADRKVEKNGLLQLCKDMGVTLIAYSPIAQGLLTGKYTLENPPPFLRRISRATLLRAQPLLAAMQRIGAAHGGKSQVQVALNWCLSKGTLPIPGAKNAQQAAEFGGALGWRLSQEEIQTLEALWP